ncbi:hypothetical protein [Paenibacillus sp. MSJ-34]|uniref:hypothetical protein n=1 Tax=Paenibacillus sp. MSJ-34 TaxID=2841529 RepID=UPI001C0F83C6|nr:hypothetical protein [Paenibacillus sp. MSJ-34]MBU5441199.1 hypothetical protein [Paenibacillus sp. MSJ-34]
MPKITPNLGLKKPTENEAADIDVLNENMDTIDSAVGHLDQEMQAVKQSVSDGKALVAGAITGKGVPTSPSDPFQRMADNIGAIETDKTGDATAAAGDILAPKTAYARGQKLTGTMPNRGIQTITPGSADKAIPDGYIAPGSKVVGDPDLIPGNIRSGKDIFGVVGNVIEALGDAAAGEVLAGRTFSKAGQAGIAGTMPNRGAVSQTITQQNGQYTIPAGYHNGAGKVIAQFANLIASNVRQGINIGGVIGSLVEGKKFATGTTQNSGSSLIITGLDFTPSLFIYKSVSPTFVYYWGFVASSASVFGAAFGLKMYGTGNYIFDTGTFSSGGVSVDTRVGNINMQWIAIE